MEVPYSSNYPLFSEVERDSFRANPQLLKGRIEAVRKFVKAGGDRALTEAMDLRWRARADFAANFIAKIEEGKKESGAAIMALTGESKFGKRRRLD